MSRRNEEEDANAAAAELLGSSLRLMYDAHRWRVSSHELAVTVLLSCGT
jgi:hypothetical protein